MSPKSTPTLIVVASPDEAHRWDVSGSGYSKGQDPHLIVDGPDGYHQDYYNLTIDHGNLHFWWFDDGKPGSYKFVVTQAGEQVSEATISI